MFALLCLSILVYWRGKSIMEQNTLFRAEMCVLLICWVIDSFLSMQEHKRLKDAGIKADNKLHIYWQVKLSNDKSIIHCVLHYIAPMKIMYWEQVWCITLCHLSFDVSLSSHRTKSNLLHPCHILGTATIFNLCVAKQSMMSNTLLAAYYYVINYMKTNLEIV